VARKHLAAEKNVVAIESGQLSKVARQFVNCYKCRKAEHFVCKCRELAKPAPQVFVWAAHTAALSDVEEANNEQEEEPAEADTNKAFESDGTQEHGEEYIELEMYDNKYYTCGSDSEGLFALTEVPIGKQREKEPDNKVCMRKVWLMVSKDAMECPVLPAQGKECLITRVEVNGHRAWTKWDSGSTTFRITPLFMHVAGIQVALLATPITLQLELVGSHSIVNYGARVTMNVSDKICNVYVDVANFNCYDMIVGTPFMRTHKVLLDFANVQVVIDGRATPAHKLELEDANGHAQCFHTVGKQDNEWP
ncbi:hypothetical protein C0989_002005, partial [Termitomyces sp. Mn162]